jgi:hypothetical protein
MSDAATTAAHGRRARLRTAAAARGVPLAAILVTVAVVVLTYLAGKLAVDQHLQCRQEGSRSAVTSDHRCPPPIS